jgi:hypothetical protein
MNTGAHPVKAGFNQSGGAYFMVLSPGLSGATGQGTDVATVANSIVGALTDTWTHLHVISAAGSNSGGAFVPPTLSRTTASNVFGLSALATAQQGSNAATEVRQGKLLKDMGKTIVSSGRTFRKFAVAGTGSEKYASSFGVAGGPAVAPNAGYASFYLEVGREGSAGGATLPAPVARYF